MIRNKIEVKPNDFKVRQLHNIKNMMQTMTVTDMETELKNQYNHLIDVTLKGMYSKANSASSWKVFKKLATNFFKPRTAILSAICAENGDIISGEDMSNQIFDNYKSIVYNEAELEDIEPWPQDFQVVNGQIEQFFTRIKPKKALSFDCFLDYLFKLSTDDPETNSVKLNLANEIFGYDFWSEKAIELHLVGRLILLNRVHPKTPRCSQIRYLVAVSPVQKAIESVLLAHLQRYQRTYIVEYQKAFIPRYSTADNIIDFFNTKKSHPNVAFIDIATAFDRVDKKMMYDVLSNKKFLGSDLIRLVRFLDTNSTVQLGNRRNRTT